MFHIIESEAEILQLLRDFFSASGLAVRMFDSPISYLDYLSTPEFVPPTALIVSYSMPNVNGHQLAARVRKEYPQLKVILTSGFPEYEMTPEVRQSICAYLHKPFHFGKLITLIGVLHTCHKEPGQGNYGIFKNICQFGDNRYCPHYTGNEVQG